MPLKNPFLNGFGPKDQEQADAILAQYQEVYDAIVAGTAYIRFYDGDRKGSIARIAFDPAYRDHERPCFKQAWRGRDSEINQDFAHCSFACVATWDGRKNKVKVYVARYDNEVLLDYHDGTVWEKFDAKAAKEALLKNPNQTDINGHVLTVGDPVLYINARYGSRMTLEEGTVVEFLVSVDSKGHSFTTVIESPTGELSSLQYPESMVYRKP